MPSNVAFGSDNHAGVHPKIMEALLHCNDGYAMAYGDDTYTQKVQKLFRRHFGSNSITFLVYNGTAANILGLKALTQSYHVIYCPETAHLNVHECAGPEHYLGCKLKALPTSDGKLTIDQIQDAMFGVDDPHVAQPRVISITQPTEYGTLYSLQELKTLANFAHEHNMVLHMDGARLANAAAAMNRSFKELTTAVGVDVLSFGGTKNGMLCGETVIFFNKHHAQAFPYIRKQGMQLASKMRYLAAQFEAFFENDLWRENAIRANTMATYLSKKLHEIPEITITQPVEANTVFAIIPPDLVKKIHKKYFFHIFDEQRSEARLMCSYSMTKQDIDEFITTLKNLIDK